jgi:hypothetical protein
MRRQADEQPAQPITQPSPHWPPQYGEQPSQRAPASQPASQGYFFPQPAADAPSQGFATQPGQHQTQPSALAGSVHPLPFNRFPAGSEAPQASAHQPPFNRFGQNGAAADPNFGFGSRTAPDQGYDYAGGGARQPGSGPAWGQPADGRGYDLGSYGPGPDQQAYGQQDAGLFDGQQEPPFGAAHGYGETDNEYDEALGEEEEEPRRGRRGLMIVAALVGAIGLGGGMAYGYKLLFPSRTGPVAVIKDTQGPVKFKPEVADGKGFAHTDKKLVNRLGDDTGPTRAAPPASTDQADERAGDDPNAPRKVRLIPIPTGGGQPPPAQAMAAAPPPAAAPAPAPMVGLPGVMLENMGPPPGARAQMPPQPPPAAASAQMPPPAAAAPARPAQPPPVRVVTASSAPPAAEAAAPPPAKTPVPKSQAAKPPPAKVKEASAHAPPASSGSGYVAVLSSQKSRMDALKIFANMQEKYGDVLSSRTPDVQEANLGEKGVWYRLVVGPPGSRDAASGVCSQLKTAGYSGCWVTAY